MDDRLQQVCSGESVRQEFKSDVSFFPDSELVYECVALANTDGGVLWLGVEDDGRLSGVQKKHLSSPSPLIANRTVPSLNVVTEVVRVDEAVSVLRIEVPQVRGLVGTTDGRYAKRRIKYDGSPETVLMTPFEIQQRMANLGLLDPSAQPMRDVPLSSIDPLQRERMRNTVKRSNHSDKSLLELSDEEFDAALQLTRTIDGVKYLTLSGVLFLTNERILREYVPSHEVAFQILNNTDVLVNEHSRKPLIEVFDDFDLRFQARVEEREFLDGLIRVHVPNYDVNGFREAFVNALVHRDYGTLGTVIVKLDENGLSISNPGGFVEGVTLRNLLTVEPKSRNFALADIAKRIGLAERTGRGIDRIYEGVLRYGRPAPDYSATTGVSVSLFIANAQADFNFLELILREEGKIQHSMPLDSLIILSSLREERRMTAEDLSARVQKSEFKVHAALEQLVESGLLERDGHGRKAAYMLSREIYQQNGKMLEYARQKNAGDALEEKILAFLHAGAAQITRKDVMELCNLDKAAAYRLLSRMANKKNKLVLHGTRSTAYYTLREIIPR